VEPSPGLHAPDRPVPDEAKDTIAQEDEAQDTDEAEDTVDRN